MSTQELDRLTPTLHAIPAETTEVTQNLTEMTQNPTETTKTAIEMTPNPNRDARRAYRDTHGGNRDFHRGHTTTPHNPTTTPHNPTTTPHNPTTTPHNPTMSHRPPPENRPPPKATLRSTRRLPALSRLSRGLPGVGHASSYIPRHAPLTRHLIRNETPRRTTHHVRPASLEGTERCDRIGSRRV